MKIATYNVNGANGRLDVLLRWFKEASPDVLCLQELESPNTKFPAKELEKAGCGAIWQGQKSWNGVAILGKGKEPLLTRRGLPGDPDDTHSRYIEAAIDGIVIGCLYLPNGNPAPGPKFDYKLGWLERLSTYAGELLAMNSRSPLPATTMSYRQSWTSTDLNDGSTMRSSALRCVMRIANSLNRVGEMSCATSILKSVSTRFGTTSGTPMDATPIFGSIIFFSVELWPKE